MAKTLPIRLRTLAAAVTVIASGLIIWNAYQYIIGSSDVDGATIPIITAEKEPFRVVPEDPGGAFIPNKDSHLYNVLKPSHTDDLVLDGVSLERDGEEDQDLSYTDVEGEGFALPEIAEKKTESLFGEIAQLKVKDIIEDDADLSEMSQENREDLKQELGEAIIENEMEAAQDPIVKKLTTVKTSRPDNLDSAKDSNPKTPDNTVDMTDMTTVPLPTRKPTRTALKNKSGGENRQQEFSIDRMISGQGTTKHHYIQLASLQDEQAAKSAYQKIREDFPQLVAGASVFYPKADLGARGTFTRIQIGPFTGEEARKRCADYTAAARRGTCLVVSR